MKSNKSALAFIFATVLIDVIGLGIIIPVIPPLIKELTGEGLSEAAGYGGLLMGSFAVMQFFFSPVLGELSDKFGRRPILLMSLFGLSLDYLFHAYAPTIAWLFVGRLLAGVTGASHTVAMAYIADVSTEENKAKNFGLVGAAFGLGFIIGPAIGGIFGEIDMRLPFYIAAGLGFANFIFGLIMVPESLPKEKRRELSIKKMLPGVSLVHIGKFPALGGLIVAFFLAMIAGQALPSTWTYFTMEMYDWNEAEVGYSLSFVGLLVAIVQGGLVGKAVKMFGSKKVIMFGFVLWSCGMLTFALAAQPWMLYAFLIPYAFGGVATPTLQSLLSNQVPADEQGNLQGAMTSLTSIASIVGPLIAASMFYWFTGARTWYYFPGAPYVSSAFILVIASLVVYWALKKIQST